MCAPCWTKHYLTSELWCDDNHQLYLCCVGGQGSSRPPRRSTQQSKVGQGWGTLALVSGDSALGAGEISPPTPAPVLAAAAADVL